MMEAPPAAKLLSLKVSSFAWGKLDMPSSQEPIKALVPALGNWAFSSLQYPGVAA